MKNLLKLAFFIGFLAFAPKAFAATLSLSPASQSVAVGQNFTVNINLDTQGASIEGVDILYLNYNPSLLNVVDANSSVAGIQIAPGTLLTNTLANSVDAAQGRITFSQVNAGGVTLTGTGVLATVTFNAKTAGTANATFSFTPGSTIDTNVASNGADVLTSVANGAYTLGSGGATPPPAPAPSPSPSPTPTPTPTPSPAPSGGGGGGGGGSVSPPVSPSPAGPTGGGGSSSGPGGSSQPTANLVYLKLINHSGTFYVVQNNQRLGVTNPGMLFSYGLEFKDAKTATAEQRTLPQGAILQPGDGALVKSPNDPTVFLISGRKKHGFVSAKVFTDLGFKWSSVLVVTAPELNALSLGEILADSQARHKSGLNINDNGTVYFLTDTHRHAYSSLSVWNSWNVDNDFSRVAPANAADRALPTGEAVNLRVIE